MRPRWSCVEGPAEQPVDGRAVCIGDPGAGVGSFDCGGVGVQQRGDPLEVLLPLPVPYGGVQDGVQFGHPVVQVDQARQMPSGGDRVRAGQAQ